MAHALRLDRFSEACDFILPSLGSLSLGWRWGDGCHAARMHKQQGIGVQVARNLTSYKNLGPGSCSIPCTKTEWVRIQKRVTLSKAWEQVPPTSDVLEMSYYKALSQSYCPLELLRHKNWAITHACIYIILHSTSWLTRFPSCDHGHTSLGHPSPGTALLP